MRSAERSFARLTAEVFEAAVPIAGRAPSVHNTQPWHFTLRAEDVEVRVDPRRRLDVVDPHGRQLLISCGAALYGLRLGLRAYGLRPETAVLPDRHDATLVARVGAAAGLPPTGNERRLLAAVYRRHTHRGPFGTRQIPDELLGELQADSVAEGAMLIVLDDPVASCHLAQLTAAAASARSRDGAYLAELRMWTRPRDSDARDGVPATAHPSHPPSLDRDGWPERDFDLDRQWGRLRLTGDRAPGVLAVLTTAGDLPSDWIAAGQALHRIQLHAATRWFFAAIDSQACELAGTRAALPRLLDLRGGYPQLVLRLGSAHISATTPRRSVRAVTNG